MSFTKITTTELNSRGATTLPNQPAMSATALKQEFDAPAKNIVAPKFNNLVDELEATTAAASLGAVAPTGRIGNNVQGVMNSISSDLDTLAANTSTAIAEAHAHSNKALLDDYEQTEADLADAVLQKHSHSNKALLDSYTQTETDLADAVLKRHTHGNKAELDKISESSGKPNYNGKDISGSLDDAFSRVVVGTTTLTANGASQLELKAGANITLLPNAADNSVEIVSSGGGGGGGGDMLQSVYDTNKDGIVNSADTINGLTASVSELNILDGVTATSSEINNLSGTTGNVQTQLNAKADSSDLNNYYTKSDVDTKMQRVVQYAGTKQFSDLTSSLLNSTYVNNFFMLTDDGEITSANINLWNDNFIVGDHVPKDSHIAVIAYTGSDASKGAYVFDDFGGFVETDEYTTSKAPVNGVVTFPDLNPDYGYDLYVDIPDETTSLPTNLTDLPVCKWTKVQRSTKADGTITLAYTVTNINVNYCLRILK